MSLISVWSNSLFVFLSSYERRCTIGEGSSISLIGTTFPWYKHIGTSVVSLSVKLCMTEDLFPHILVNVVDIEREYLSLHTPLLNKTPRLSSARMFVILYRLLIIHCIYVSVTKPACPALSAWLNTGSIRSLEVTIKKLLCSVVWHHYQRYVQHYVHGQSNVGSMCDCKPCRSLDLSVLVEILSGDDSDHGTGPRRNDSVNSRSALCPIERMSS